MTRMFQIDGKTVKTWNPYSGCLHGCTYCWARKAINKYPLKNSKKYRECKFNPTMHPQALGRKTFNNGDHVFVCDMGDMWGRWMKFDEVRTILVNIELFLHRYPDTIFMFLTKDPDAYNYYHEQFRGLSHSTYNIEHMMLGATIETNIEHPNIYKPSMEQFKPPSPVERVMALKMLHPLYRKFVSIEPIMDFNDGFAEMIIDIGPELVFIGYDNYDNHLIEPSLSKAEALVQKLESNRIKVIRKNMTPNSEVIP